MGEETFCLLLYSLCVGLVERLARCLPQRKPLIGYEVTRQTGRKLRHLALTSKKIESPHLVPVKWCRHKQGQSSYLLVARNAG